MKLPESTITKMPAHLQALFAKLPNPSSDEVLAAFPDTKSGGGPAVGTPRSKVNTYGEPTVSMTPPKGASEGSAARFFYCAKASRKDRDEGLTSEADKRANIHPTVKPTSLMAYLCRLITPPGGTILDPFMGSGSTGKAAVLEGFNFVGIEREDEYMPIAEARIAWAVLRMQGGIVDVDPPTEEPVAAQAQPANDSPPDLFSANDNQVVRAVA